MTDNVQPWFLAQIKPNSQKIAQTNLMRQGIETFVPMEEKTTQRQGRFMTRLVPLFSGYAFINLKSTDNSWRQVNSTYGVSRIVSFNGKPSPVPADFVHELQKRCDDTGKLVAETVFDVGDAVRVVKGPFANLVAQIENIAADRRVWLLMELLGGKQRVSVSADELRAV